MNYASDPLVHCQIVPSGQQYHCHDSPLVSRDIQAGCRGRQRMCFSLSFPAEPSSGGLVIVAFQ